MENEKALTELIGRKVAERRAGLGLSLDDLSNDTGVSRAMISRIERGEVHASAVVLDRLCGGIGITLSSLFARESVSPLLRRTDQPVWRDPESGYVRREVAPTGSGAPGRIAEIEFPAGAQVAFKRSRTRVVEQLVWVVEGRVEIDLPGETFRLGPGDCLHMKHNEDVVFRNPTSAPARYALFLPGESTK